MKPEAESGPGGAGRAGDAAQGGEGGGEGGAEGTAERELNREEGRGAGTVSRGIASLKI